MVRCDFIAAENAQTEQNEHRIVSFEPRFFNDDGLTLKIRPINPNDTEAWVVFVNGLSHYSKYYRFHRMIKDVTANDAQPFCNIDYTNSFALVAELETADSSKIIAVGRYARINNTNHAEFAIVVDDKFQKRGIGAEIMKTLAQIAYENGITTFEGFTLIENYEIVNFLKKCGFEVRIMMRTSMQHVSFPTNRMVGVRGFEPPTT
ncbi:MAG: GNAT family N-acetyltransferase [Dehalococcoidales bacterium]